MQTDYVCMRGKNLVFRALVPPVLEDSGPASSRGCFPSNEASHVNDLGPTQT